MSKLTSLARDYGLKSDLIDAEEWPDPAAPDAGLTEAITDDPIAALDQLRRRGLDSRLVGVMWKLFEQRPVELGLFAWDVLCNSLFPATADLARYREAAAVVQDVLPAAGRRYAATEKVSAGDLVRRLALPAFQKLADPEMDTAARFNALGAIEANQIMSREHGRPLAEKALHAAHQFAKFLSLAHLSTLATFYLDYLSHRCEYQPAIADWVEALLDARGTLKLDKEHLLDKASIEELDLNAYAFARRFIESDAPEMFIDEVRKHSQLPDYSTKPAAEIAKDHPRATLVMAHAFLAEDQTPVPFEVVNEIVKQSPGWRYAGRVRLVLLAYVTPVKSDLPLRVLDQFLATFGNDVGTWQDFDTYSKSGNSWSEGAYARVVREVMELPHDRAAWEALGIKLEDQQQWLEQVAERIAVQCKLA